jgi:ABC-type glycerol-3-phosphate transport system substrate-binding protein
MSAAGDPVDASFMNVFRARDLYDTGQLRDLDGYIRLAPDVADDKFLSASEPLRKLRSETYGIPTMGPESWCLIVNGNIFRAEGLNPQGSDIKTWDDLARVAQQLTRRSGDDVTRSGFLMPQVTLHQFSGWVNTNGTGLFDVEQTKAFYSAPATVATLQFLNRLYDGMRVSVPLEVPNRPAAPGAILGGDAAMMVESTSSLALRYQSAPPDFQWGIGMIPFPKGPNGRGPATSTWMNPVVFPKGARHTEQAFEFARWFCGNADLAYRRFQLTNGASPLRAFFQSSRWQARVKEWPVLGAIQHMAELPGAYPYRRVDAQNKEVLPLLQDGFTGKAELRASLQQAQTVADRLLSV